MVMTSNALSFSLYGLPTILSIWYSKIQDIDYVLWYEVEKMELGRYIDILVALCEHNVQQQFY
jgi:hypothetical protein